METPARQPSGLVFQGIQKAFYGVRVLNDISFTVRAGSIVGLVGENGAGKSTLMNILGGNLPPDAGAMSWEGQPFAPASPRAAEQAGIAFVHQELNLFPNLTIAENLFLTRFPTRACLIHRRDLRQRASRLLAQVGLDVTPETVVERLSAGERQLVEIARTLALPPRMLILDEPTTSLSAREAERLFALVNQLRRDGLAIIYISHALDEVLRLADEIVVLRDGQLVGHGSAAKLDVARLVTLMVGRPLLHLYPARQSTPAAAVVLSAEHLTHPQVVRDVSFEIRRGEVLGLFGLLGAGRTELARILFGLEPCAQGTLRLLGEPLTGPPRRRVQRGLAFLTEDRRRDGLCLEASVTDNVALVTLPRRARTPLRILDEAGLQQDVSGIRAAVRLQTRLHNDQPVRTLSGGNQQKIVLARWLLAQPKLLILDEPTRGIDVGAKFEIYQLILDLADAGAAVLLISSELEELTGLCDRILVMSRGRLRGDFTRPGFDREQLLRAALTDVP
jgi:ABC-type sugar transport system ATPase subunit